MPKDTEFDPTEMGTLRPNEPAKKVAGQQFQPMNIDERPTHIILPDEVTPFHPYTLFELYYSDKMIESMVQSTNNYKREVGESKCPRGNDWYNTCLQEIYLYLAIRIYMTLHEENEINDYWKEGDLKPIHPCADWLSVDRFNELHIRYEIGDNNSILYTRVCKNFPFFPPLYWSFTYQLIVGAFKHPYSRNNKRDLGSWIISRSR